MSNYEISPSGSAFPALEGSEPVERLADAFRALAHPHRLRIFMRLVRCCPPGSACEVPGEDAGAPCVGDLGKDLGVVPSTVSHHMKELRRAGLVRVERRGQTIECRVDEEMFAALHQFFANPGAARDAALPEENR